MSHPSPRVSVCLPVYNSEDFVAEALDSVLQQTFTDFECLVIDDGSQDASLDILKTYAEKDSRIILISRENRGQSATRNEMIKRARGEFIAVMDADDIALPQRLHQQVEFLDQHPDVVCVGGGFDIIDHRGRFLTTLQLPEADAQIQSLALTGHGSICHPCAFIRSSALLQIDGYDESLKCAADLDLWLRLGEIGKLANLNTSILQYRLHTQSVSGKNTVEQRQTAKRVCEQAWQRRGISGTFEASEPWRPGIDRPSRHKFTLQYGWWAYNSRQRWTAIDYGMQAIALRPFHPEGWKLIVASLLMPLAHNA